MRADLASGRCTSPIESISAPNTVPWPQPVVTVRVAVRSVRMPPRVATAAAATSQSTLMASMAAAPATRRWLSR